MQMLADFGFTFDLTVRSSQLRDVIQLVDRCPQVEFILDHIGKPNIREHEFEVWKEPFSALAKRPNVACKVSGVLTEADLNAWTPAVVQPYIVHAIDCFGIDRVLFGGDWPVLRLAATYSEWLDVLQIALEDYSLPEQCKFYQTNAERVYRLT
jgi:L-fuconolactonase